MKDEAARISTKADSGEQRLGPMSQYDIIGDVHGCADLLVGLLDRLGYRQTGGVFRNPDRQAVFVGDLIDRGKYQLETLSLVRSMVDAGSAQLVMGNHEFNAISYATPNPGTPGEFMRPHSEKNTKQHQSFLDEVPSGTPEYAEWINWFKTLPLYLDLDDIRVVHACWSRDHIGKLNQWISPGEPMTTEFVVRANQKGSQEHRAIEVLLKGPELSLDQYGQPGFMDKDGHVRHDARIRWWRSAATTLRELAEIPPASQTADGHVYPQLPELACPDQAAFDYRDTKPVFYGHYWRNWEPLEGEDWTNSTVCVDFSAVKGGPLVAYRWDGNSVISRDSFVACGGSAASARWPT